LVVHVDEELGTSEVTGSGKGPPGCDEGTALAVGAHR
jgi:hypothetical protein